MIGEFSRARGSWGKATAFHIAFHISHCLPTARDLSLVAFVASALVHTKIITTGRHTTCHFRHPQSVARRVQLLQLLPFRPEFSLSYQTVREQRRARKRNHASPNAALYDSQLYPPQPQMSAVNSGKSADFLKPLTQCCQPVSVRDSSPLRAFAHRSARRVAS